MRSLIRTVKFEAQKRLVGFDVPQEPHLDPQGTRAFYSALENCTSYLEYGAGGSTLAAVRNNKPGITIEGDRHYCNSVQRTVKSVAENPVRTLQYVDIGWTGPWGMPRFRKPTPKRRRKWMRYVQHPFLDNSHYDLVMIDGRFRVACALQVLRYCVQEDVCSTVLIDDYSRPEYRRIEEFIRPKEIIGRMALFEMCCGKESKLPKFSDVEESLSLVR